MRYLYSSEDDPREDDYFYEATKTTNYHFPRIPQHSHCFYEIYIFLNGDIRLKVRENIIDVEHGDIIIIPPYVVHQLLPVDDNYDTIYDRIYMYLTKPCLQSFDFRQESIYTPLKLAADNRLYRFHINNHRDFQTILDCMIAVYRRKKEHPAGRELLDRADILKMITLISVSIKEEAAHHNGAIGNPLLEQVADFLKQHYQAPLALDDIANHFYTNKHTLAKHFKAHFGISIRDYQTTYRIKLAKEEILNGMPPTKASLLVGFTDYSTFYRTFIKMEGVSPKDFVNFISEEK